MKRSPRAEANKLGVALERLRTSGWHTLARKTQELQTLLEISLSLWRSLRGRWLLVAGLGPL